MLNLRYVLLLVFLTFISNISLAANYKYVFKLGSASDRINSASTQVSVVTSLASVSGSTLNLELASIFVKKGNSTSSVRLDGNTISYVYDWPVKMTIDGVPVSTPPSSATPLIPGRSAYGRVIVYQWIPSTYEFVPAPYTQEQIEAAYNSSCAKAGFIPEGYYNCISWARGFRDYVLINNFDTWGFINPVCPSGYSASGYDCLLQNSSSVTKPYGVACEPIFADGQFKFDTSNPNCNKKTSIEKNGCTTTITNGSFIVYCGGSDSDLEIKNGFIYFPSNPSTKPIKLDTSGSSPRISFMTNQAQSPASNVLTVDLTKASNSSIVSCLNSTCSYY